MCILSSVCARASGCVCVCVRALCSCLRACVHACCVCVACVSGETKRKEEIPSTEATIFPSHHSPCLSSPPCITETWQAHTYCHPTAFVGDRRAIHEQSTHTHTQRTHVLRNKRTFSHTHASALPASLWSHTRRPTWARQESASVTWSIFSNERDFGQVSQRVVECIFLHFVGSNGSTFIDLLSFSSEQ